MRLKCLFGHNWVTVGGALNLGNGKFKKKFKCTKCGKFKEIIS